MIDRVGVIGCGLMGSGIAHISARAGFTTIVLDVSDKILVKGITGIHRFIEKGISLGKTPAAELELVKKHLTATTRLEDLKDCDIIIEAAPEKLELKTRLFAELDSITSENTIFASNTSSLKIAELARATNRRDRFIGAHFFNPAPLMKLVEVARMEETSGETFQTVMEFIRKLGKTPVACTDTTGFIVNRLLNPYLLDAVRAFEAGVASIEDIDRAMTLGCGYPMGPLTLIDFIGLDTVLHITEIMAEEFKLPCCEPPALLRKMVEKGMLGRKSKAGFYDYSGEEPAPNDSNLKTLK